MGNAPLMRNGDGGGENVEEVAEGALAGWLCSGMDICSVLRAEAEEAGRPVSPLCPCKLACVTLLCAAWPWSVLNRATAFADPKPSGGCDRRGGEWARGGGGRLLLIGADSALATLVLLNKPSRGVSLGITVALGEVLT